MNLDLDLKVEVRAQSSSVFTQETVDRRLTDLNARHEAGDQSAAEEIDYLLALKKRMWGE